jgi:hypothetical protein
MHINMQPLKEKKKNNFGVVTPSHAIYLTDLLFVQLYYFSIMLQHVQYTCFSGQFYGLLGCDTVLFRRQLHYFGGTCCLQLQGVKQTVHISEHRKLTIT